MTAKFGPAGAGESFYAQGHKSSLEMCKWLAEMGLDAYEYQCNKGVSIREDTARKLGATAKEYNIALSVHAPYYINLASPEEEKRQKSVDYILQTLTAADYMGASRIVVHSGATAKLARREAMGYAKMTLTQAQSRADEMNLSHIRICPETMGKINQLGDLDEVMELCCLDERFLPTIDFGHLYSRSLGALIDLADFEAVFNTMENRIGIERARIFHCHFSRMEYTKGGEKKHHTYADTQYGPDFEPVAELTAKKGFSPVIICESNGTQPEDAKIFKEMYERFKRENL